MNTKTFFWKTLPDTRTDIVGQVLTIVGIAATINSDIPIDLDPVIRRGFFIQFLLNSGKTTGELNTDTDAFAKKMTDAGMTQQQAEDAIYGIVKSLEGFTTDEQKYAAAGQLAAAYGYTLAPLSEQNGDPLYVAPPPPVEEDPGPNVGEPV